MLTVKFIEENRDYVIERLAVKRFNAKDSIDLILDLDKQRRNIQNRNDSIQATLNAIAKEVGVLFKSGKVQEAEAAKVKTAQLKEESKQLGIELEETEVKLKNQLVQLPNVPHSSVPSGNSAEENVVVRTGGAMPNLAADAVPHWDLAKNTTSSTSNWEINLPGLDFRFIKEKDRNYSVP